MPKGAPSDRDSDLGCRGIVFHAVRSYGTHPVVIDGAEVGRGIFYHEVVELIDDKMSPSTVRFQLGSLYHRGVIDKMMTVSRYGNGPRPLTIYWTDPGWSEDDPRRPALEAVVYTPANGVGRGHGRSHYSPDGPTGRIKYAEGIHYPAWSRPPRSDVGAEYLAQRAFPWAKEDGTEEDPTLDWFDRRGRPFATSNHRNPYGPGHPDDLRHVRWFVSRLDTPGYGGAEYDKTKVRNTRRRYRTGK